MKKAIDHLKQSDPVLGAIIDRVGPYRMSYGEPTFESLARSIVYQQLSGKAASTIYGRFAAAAGEPLTPEGVLRLSLEQMRALGLSQQKAKYVRDLAELSDEEVIEHLTQVKGVGVWTVHMFLMFYLRRPNVLPTGDLGICNAVKKAYRMRKHPKPLDIEKRAKKWHPYCSVASWYLWRSLELKDEDAASTA
jgi:DNA-3-methyladenine glycosylase II